MNTVLRNYASDAASTLAKRTVRMLNSVPQGARNLAFKDLLKNLDPGVSAEVSAARDRGYSFEKALEIGYRNMVEAQMLKAARAPKGGMGGYRMDWGGLRGGPLAGPGAQNAPASSGGSTSGGTASGGTASGGGGGGFDMDALTRGIGQASEAIDGITGLIGSIGGAYGAITDLITGGEQEPAPAPAPEPVHVAQIAPGALSLVRRGLNLSTTGPTATSYTWSLSSLPTWALALGAAVAAGTTFWAVKKYVLKPKKS